MKVPSAHHLMYKAFHKPDSVLLDVCTICRASCFYCIHQRRKLANHEMMSAHNFEVLIGILRRDGIKLIHLYQSGEPFLHPSLPEFIKIVAQKGMNSSTATKLYMPINFDVLDKALNYCDTTKQTVEFLITIDSASQSTMSIISPGISVDVQQDNLFKLSFISEKHKSLKVKFSTIVNRYNEDELENIHRFIFNQLRFNRWSANSFGYYMPQCATQTDIETIKGFMPKQEQFRKRLSMDSGQLVSLKRQCPFPLTPAIDVHGDVSICCHDMLHSTKLGNLLEVRSLAKLMKTTKYQETYRASQKMSLDICKGCN